MSGNETVINDVTDTSLWVAYYRARESERSDALFKDPYAKMLVGERGKKIARHMAPVARFSSWTVVIRTVIIDRFLGKLIEEGIDTVINLGAGMDTRPYRMKLPANLRWFEVDFPHIIALKNEVLESETPQCQLTRVAVDLVNDEKRKRFLCEVGAQAKKAVVLTEGVIPYLSEEKVATLAQELHQQPGILYWITEYHDPKVYPYLKGKLRTKKLKNAPFRFFPEHWLPFFEKQGWVPREICYSGEESVKHRRRIPIHWWAYFLKVFVPKARREVSKRMSGFILFKKA